MRLLNTRSIFVVVITLFNFLSAPFAAEPTVVLPPYKDRPTNVSQSREIKATSYTCAGTLENGDVLELNLVLTASSTSMLRHGLYQEVIIKNGTLVQSYKANVSFSLQSLVLNLGTSSMKTTLMEPHFPEDIIEMFKDVLEPSSPNEWKQGQASYSGLTFGDFSNPLDIPSALHISMPLEAAMVEYPVETFNGNFEYFSSLVKEETFAEEVLYEGTQIAVDMPFSCILKDDDYDFQELLQENSMMDIKKSFPMVNTGGPLHFESSEDLLNISANKLNQLLRITALLHEMFEDEDIVIENQYGKIILAGAGLAATGFLARMALRTTIAMAFVHPQYLTPILHPEKKIVRITEPKGYTLEEIKVLLDGPNAELVEELQLNPQLLPSIEKLYSEMYPQYFGDTKSGI